MKILIPLATGAVEVLLKAGDSLRLSRGKDKVVEYLGLKVEQPHAGPELDWKLVG